MIRGVVWDRFDLADTLSFYGTIGGKWRMKFDPKDAYLPVIKWGCLWDDIGLIYIKTNCFTSDDTNFATCRPPKFSVLIRHVIAYGMIVKH